MGSNYDLDVTLSEDFLGDESWFRPIASRLDGPFELKLVHAEYLYEKYCLVKLNKPSLQPSTGSTFSPTSLWFLALEAFRKREFIEEWLKANEKCLLSDFSALHSFEYFQQAELLLQMAPQAIVSLLSNRYGISLPYCEVYFDL